MTEKLYKCHVGVVGVHIGVGTEEHELTGDECRDLLNALHEENEDHKYLCSIYVDFLVSKGYELADVIEYSKEMEE